MINTGKIRLKISARNALKGFGSLSQISKANPISFDFKGNEIEVHSSSIYFFV